jgi:hypothetical protein
MYNKIYINSKDLHTSNDNNFLRYSILKLGKQNHNIYNIIVFIDLLWKELMEKQLLVSH